MKIKLLQVLLGALGSALSILITHFANLPPDVALGVAAVSGPAATAILPGALKSIFV